MRVERDIAIDASREEIWELVAEPCDYDRFWHGLTRLERKNDEKGLGARYALRMRIGSADVGGLVEIVECDEAADMAWTSITGLDHRARWRLREADDGRTKVTLRLSWDAPGLLGTVADRLAGADGGANSGANASESGTRARGRGGQGTGERRGRQEPAREGGVRAGQREDPDRGRGDPPDAAGSPLPRAADAPEVGPQPGRGSDLARRALPGGHDDRRRARHAELLARSTRGRMRSRTRSRTRVSARATAWA